MAYTKASLRAACLILAPVQARDIVERVDINKAIDLAATGAALTGDTTSDSFNTLQEALSDLYSASAPGLKFSNQPNKPKHENLSSVSEELSALDYELGQIARELSNIAACNDATGREHAIKSAKRAIDTAAQRSYRASQISRGLKVAKPN